MKEVLGKIETWEQNWAKYEVDNGVTLDIDLMLGALLKMFPPKQEEAIKLCYIEDESKLTYPVLRRQVELWMDAIQHTGADGPLVAAAEQRGQPLGGAARASPRCSPERQEGLGQGQGQGQ